MFRQIPTILALSKPVKMHYLKAPTSKKLRIDAAGYQASIIDYCFDIFTVIECGFKERFICLSQGFNTLVVFTQTSKPSADGLWGWYLYAFMNILNYKLDTTNELLTSRIGLITLAHTIQVLDLSKTIDQHFPALGSNCALKASTFLVG
jgi:hypothetical protein